MSLLSEGGSTLISYLLRLAGQYFANTEEKSDYNERNANGMIHFG